jgi:hypothetical protein
MVIGDDPETQLRPYQENNMDDCPEEYLAFHDIEDNYLKAYQTESTEKVVMSDGRKLNPWDTEFQVAEDPDKPWCTTKVIPEELEVKEFKFTELFDTFEDYMSEWCGYKGRDEQKGRYGYWENPEAKWDWYQLGGRWSDFFKLFPGRTGSKGERSWTNRDMPYKNGYADQVYKGDIDFETMRRQCEEEAAKHFDTVHEVIKDAPKVETWENVRNRLDGDIDQARKEYGAQEAVKLFDEFSKSEEGRNIVGFMSNVEEYQIPREDYLKNARDGAVSTFAILKDGEWYERGEMGWWACVSNEKAEEEWNAEFAKLLDEVPDDTLISLYDCHI